MNRSPGGENYLNGASHRLSQSLMSPVGSDRNKVDEIELTITIQKDACGYGMKVFHSFSFLFVLYLFYFWFYHSVHFYYLTWLHMKIIHGKMRNEKLLWTRHSIAQGSHNITMNSRRRRKTTAKFVWSIDSNICTRIYKIDVIEWNETVFVYMRSSRMTHEKKKINTRCHNPFDERSFLSRALVVPSIYR